MGLIPLTLDQTIFAVFPLLTKRYWFATAYIFLLFLTPALNALIHVLTKRQYQGLLLVLSFAFLSWPKLIPFFPVRFSDMTDVASGYSLYWLVFLYLLAAYLRIHFASQQKRYFYILVYLICATCTTVAHFAFEQNFLYRYNSITTLTASLALFMLMQTVFIPNRTITRIILQLSPLTFGVYLASEHWLVRDYIYTNLTRTNIHASDPAILVELVAWILITYIICSAIEAARRFLFQPIERSFTFENILQKIEQTWRQAPPVVLPNQNSRKGI